ncbi:MAG: hypothetical protein K5864_09840 [Bacteroidales bacterium]|nr:hypothetical protein [Bacteroidales bacterium]
MEFVELKNEIKGLYLDFFKDMKIDPKTGIVEGTNKRFSGFPYIGENYVSAPVKILFIPLDCGEDECRNKNTYHSFESREDIFKGGNLDFNDHIAGIYATALRILKDKMQLQDAWNSLWSYNEYTAKKAIALADAINSIPKDLMSFVAYENRFRFVTINREFRTGNADRIWINAERERKLLLDEIAVFNPDIIVFQSNYGIDNCGINELKKQYKVVVAYHPSCWQRGANKLQYIEERIMPQVLL